MSTFYRTINPTTSDNVESGYPLGAIWINTISYSGYVQNSDGVWDWSQEYSNTVSSNFFPILSNYSPIIYYVNSGETINNVYYITTGSTSGGTIDIGNINIGQLTGYSGENFMVVNGNGTPTENGQLLKSVYNIAKNSTPNGSPVGISNNMNIYISPGYYQTTSNLTYRVTLDNANTNTLSGTLGVSITTVHGSFIFNGYSDNVTPNNVLSTIIPSAMLGEIGSFGDIYSVSPDNETGLPIVGGSNIYLDYEFMMGYSIEPCVLSISVTLDGSPIYSPTIQKTNSEPLTLDTDGLNLKTLYPSSLSAWNLSDNAIAGGPIIDAVSITGRVIALDGISVSTKFRISKPSANVESSLIANNCFISGLGTVLFEYVSGGTIYVGGYYKNCKLSGCGLISPGSTQISELYIAGSFQDCTFIPGFGICADPDGTTGINLKANFTNCVCSGPGFGVSLSPNAKIIISGDFYNCITTSSGFGSGSDGGIVSLSGTCVNCISNTKSLSNLAEFNVLTSFASGASNNTISGKIFNCSMIQSGSFNTSNLSTGVIANCINSNGSIANSYS